MFPRFAARAIWCCCALALAGGCAAKAPEPEPTAPARTGGASGGGSGTPTASGGAPGTGGAGGTAGNAGGTGTGGAGAGSGGVSGTGGTTSSGGEDARPEPPAPVDGGTGDAPAANPSASGLLKIFDGTSWDNWEYDPKVWTLKDGAMSGQSPGGQSQAFTKKDYSNFRLIVWSRMPKGKDHLGICLWGSRPAAGRYGFGGCLLVIPPNGAIWDYLENKDYPKPDYQKGMEEWHRTEILANRDAGKVLVAIGGKLIHEFQDTPTRLARRKAGPIGMQVHKAGEFVSEYKDIEIEVDPKSDKLITVTP
jgi:Domain of Unknown Function (DUF1080)